MLYRDIVLPEPSLGQALKWLNAAINYITWQHCQSRYLII